jgi:hypothetical protein
MVLPQLRPTETPIEPVPSLPRLTTMAWHVFARPADGAAISAGRNLMRTIARCLATTSLVLVTAALASPSWAADVDATSAIDTVTVYPDGATVTRVIAIDLASGDNTLVAKDFPLSLDPSSLRVEGEAGAKLTIGTIDARPPRAAPTCKARSMRRPPGANSRSALPKPLPPVSATRERRVRSPNGAPPLPPWLRKLPLLTLRSVMPHENSARSIARSRSLKPIAPPSRRASSRFASTSPPRPRPRRRSG